MRRMFKKAAALILGAAMTVTMGTSAFATGWQKNDTGWWYGTNSDNTTWYANEWQWIDAGNNRAYCYYFDQNGYMLTNTMTSDGYYVDAEGRWVTDLGLVNGVVQTKIVPTATSGGTSMPTVGGSSGGTTTPGTTTTAQATTTVANGNEIRKAMKPGDTYAVSNGTWIRDEKGFKFKKLDGFYVDPTHAQMFQDAYNPFVVNDRWMTDDNGDGTWEIYAFDENGYLYTKVSESNSGFNPFGLNNADGYLTTRHYRGTWGAIGPYEVVQHGDKWLCENGTLPDFSANAYWEFTGDYALDAGRISSGIEHEIARVSSHNNIVYKYMN